ncbi:MAG: hypothetical protein HC896_13915 [Bacteroidales bacterium]|nr:hypothetical protein [Bacteroidales bacterium]
MQKVNNNALETLLRHKYNETIATAMLLAVSDKKLADKKYAEANKLMKKMIAVIKR